MRVIDFRARPNTAEYMALYDNPASRLNWEVRFKYPKPPAETLETFMAAVQAHGIDRIVFTGRQTSTRGISNDYIASCVQRYPDRIIGFAGVDVAAGAAAVAELERAVTQLGLRGVSLDDNVYLETSIYEFLPGGDLFVQYANDVASDKFLYASAFPFRPLSDLDLYKRFPFKPGVLEQILWDNPARLLRIQ
jgi:predicted TIM-barrel fold metal-dependent hydrolase